MQLRQLDSIPNGLLDCEAHELHDFLGGPTLIHLAGQKYPALFVSILMHGNETTGWEAMRELLRTTFVSNPNHPPRAISLFIANTEAAKHKVRHLPNQPDYNRVWPGSELTASSEHELMLSVLKEMQHRGVFASVDIHNNTGLNPHYACVHDFDPQNLKLATLFGRTVVYFIRPLGVQSIAMNQFCPSITLECGKAGQAYGREHVINFLTACLHLHKIPDTKVAPHDLDLFHTTATVYISDGVSFGFNQHQNDLVLPTELEKFNFQELPVGTVLGNSELNGKQILRVTNEAGNDAFDEYFTMKSGVIKTRKPLMPAMLTANLEVIRQDCLCYLMERYQIPQDQFERSIDNAE